MRSFLLKNNKPIISWGALSDGTLFQGEIPEGYDAGYYQLMQMRRKLMETESADEEIKLLKYRYAAAGISP